MKLEEFLKNGIFSKSKLAVSLYSGEDKMRALRRYLIKEVNYNYNKFSTQERAKLYKILGDNLNKGKMIINKMRYLVEESKDLKNHWVCIDKIYKIVIIWENKRFNESQKVSELEDASDSLRLAKIIREMGDFLVTNHAEKL